MTTEPPTARLHARLVRALFELLYRNRALYWFASTVPFAGQWRRWQRLVLPRIRGREVLEVGCGTGDLLADLVAAGYTCTALDRSPQMVAAARATLRRRSLATSHTQVVQGSVFALPWAEATFDTVVSTFPTEYIYAPEAMREIGRVLRPGGRLLVVLGAYLLPTTPLLLPLVGLQTLVYGQRAKDISRQRATCVSGRLHNGLPPLTERGMELRAECVRGPFWVAYVVQGEKPCE